MIRQATDYQTWEQEAFNLKAIQTNKYSNNSSKHYQNYFALIKQLENGSAFGAEWKHQFSSLKFCTYSTSSLKHF